MAKEYVFWYSDSATYKAGIEANSLEEAIELLDSVFQRGETALEDLPGFWNKHKDGEYDYSPETVEEI
jgi:hypothetical protein